MHFNLNKQDKRIFAWIANRMEQNKGILVYFTEVIDALGISTEEFYACLQKLNKHRDVAPVKRVHWGESVEEGNFLISEEAVDFWRQYQQTEQDKLKK